ncbi:DUF5681 domain-containing protein [Shewanella sp. 6_MG-2023]|uniref:DUF5681 domain-containing protein n=1 Tax=Shewanella sp. 6_MG-2023 TaxID=3062660 RepID=UPI0026E479A7|nr:DUF5681 domain-containing protein [Shewanella sp. 6_MG-2023]MDO6617443.1 hypothetical protein [Shewanella sp. 6_MG-2023]
MTNRTSKGQFSKGCSGNLNGRPNSQSTEVREALKVHGQDIVDQLMIKVREGDTAAIKIALDRISPPLKPVTEPVKMNVEDTSDLVGIAKTIINEMLAGNIDANTASVFITQLKRIGGVVETDKYIKNVNEIDSMFSTKLF